MFSTSNIKLCVMGLGYVGLPLAIEFSKSRKVVSFDIDKDKIKDLKKRKDINNSLLELDDNSFSNLVFSYREEDIRDCNFYIVAVPTPIKEDKIPDLTFLTSSSEIIGKNLKEGDIVVYESTVYPGCTEEECVPVLEKTSGLKFNKDFFCGYSPERINPGKGNENLSEIIKLTSGSNPETLEIIDNLYNSIIEAGTYKVESIKVAETAKVLENTQRDVNIALMNELSIICNKLNIETSSVIKAASTKWNFTPYEPGLVGGHCIGVDPYYLTHKSRSVGYTSKLVTTGREVNEAMPTHLADLIKSWSNENLNQDDVKVLVLGCTFKENCSDSRNSKIFETISSLREEGLDITVNDPHPIEDDVFKEYGVVISPLEDIRNKFDIVILASPHTEYLDVQEQIADFTKSSGLFVDVKSSLDKDIILSRGLDLITL